MSGADHEVPHYAVFSSPLAINPFTVETSVALIKKKIYIFIAGLGAGGSIGRCAAKTSAPRRGLGR